MTKAIMYHYIRPDEPNLPHFKHLHIEDFSSQLDWIGNTYGFVGKNDFINSFKSNQPVNGVVLTFDDGFKDHYQYALPELLKRDLWGIFYIPTAPYHTGKLIDVHRIHLLIGKNGGSVIAEALNDLVSDDMLSHAHIDEFHRSTYTLQRNDDATNYVKRLLNYFIDYTYRELIIDKLMGIFFNDEMKLVCQHYISSNELLEMHNSGMMIGSHTVNHPVMSKLPPEKQGAEIAGSFDFIESIVGPSIRTFCYPYGGFHSFTKETEVILESKRSLFSFNVEARDISSQDLSERRQALPRYDCNAFPFGLCR